MTNLNHQLRTRSSAISRSMLLVLLVSWLSMVCPPCVSQAEAAPVSASTMPCHSQQAPAADQQPEKNTCPHAHGGPCADGNCAVITAITVSEPAAILVLSAEPPFFLLPATVATRLNDRPLQYRPAPLRLVAAAERPLYLRHCSFLT